MQANIFFLNSPPKLTIRHGKEIIIHDENTILCAMHNFAFYLWKSFDTGLTRNSNEKCTQTM